MSLILAALLLAAVIAIMDSHDHPLQVERLQENRPPFDRFQERLIHIKHSGLSTKRSPFWGTNPQVF